jgi:hypothetical protein
MKQLSRRERPGQDGPLIIHSLTPAFRASQTRQRVGPECYTATEFRSKLSRDKRREAHSD